MTITFRLWTALRCLGFIALAQSATCAAQEYPRKGIVTIVVPYAAGGTTDQQGRLAAEILGKSLGGTFVVENKLGYGGNIGADYVAKARPDGYTLLLGGIANNAINPALFQNLTYSAENDFVAVAPLASGPFVLVTSPASPYPTLKDFVAAAKARPGSINYGSAGSGTGQHLTMELLRDQAGLELQHIPYKGTPQAMADVMGGSVPVMFNNIDTVTPLVKAGKLRALGISSAERSPTLPDVPTFVEQGYPDMVAYSWVGIYAPKGTPGTIIDAINRAIVASMNSPETKARLAPMGLVPAAQTPQQFEQFTKQERERWARLVKASGAKPE
jgi:tripartite-type tricarboxylate transporter receptor subunit TctC